MTFLLPMIFTCISVTAWCEHGALLTSAVVTTYCYWLGYSALSSDPSSCNHLASNDTVHLVLSLLIAAVSVTYAGYSSSMQDISGDEEEALKPKDSGSSDAAATDSSATVPAKATDTVQQEKQAKEDEAEEAAEEVSEAAAGNVQQTSRFHIFMSCAACYMAMILTSWGAVEPDGDPISYDVSTENVWIKVVTQWVTAMVYIWTLAAPYLLPDREFGYN